MKGSCEAWEARWMMMNLHARHHFKYCAYTDASKTGEAAAAGVWEGVQEPRAQATYGGSARIRAAAVANSRGSANEQEDERVGRGLWGVRLPTHWNICDCEMYMIIEHIRTTLNRMQEGQEPGDVLTISDSLSALRTLEAAWREQTGGPSRRRNACMVEVACKL